MKKHEENFSGADLKSRVKVKPRISRCNFPACFPYIKRTMNTMRGVENRNNEQAIKVKITNFNEDCKEKSRREIRLKLCA